LKKFIALEFKLFDINVIADRFQITFVNLVSFLISKLVLLTSGIYCKVHNVIVDTYKLLEANQKNNLFKSNF